MTDIALDEKLAPCPFCGGEAERYTITEADEVANIGGDVIACTKCGASSHVEFGEKENLLDSWNRRLSPSQGEGPAADVVEAAKAVIADWDHRLPDGPESFKTNDELGFSYWSPAASMVSSEPMSRLRAALASLAPRAAQGTLADEQLGETSHVADDGQPDEAQEWHDYDPDC